MLASGFRLLRFAVIVELLESQNKVDNEVLDVIFVADVGRQVDIFPDLLRAARAFVLQHVVQLILKRHHVFVAPTLQPPYRLGERGLKQDLLHLGGDHVEVVEHPSIFHVPPAVTDDPCTAANRVSSGSQTSGGANTGVRLRAMSSVSRTDDISAKLVVLVDLSDSLKARVQVFGLLA